MSDTKIEWADRTYNPITGCSKISESCQHCYAERMSKRLAGRCGYDKDDPFKVTLHPDKLTEPLHWKKPSRIFVCSMGDLFHEDVPDQWIDQVFAMMAKAMQHTFLLLTKRPERMRNYIIKAMYDDNCNYQGWYEAIEKLGIPDATPMENIMLGVTAENQQRADERIPILLQTPAAKRFVSYEPGLSEVNFSRYLKWPVCKHWKQDGNPNEYGKYHWEKQRLVSSDWVGLDLVIAGGETGPGARPMHPDWVRSLRDQCQAAGTPFFFKSWGNWAPDNGSTPYDGCRYKTWSDGQVCWKVGKKAAGRLLDGRTWDEWPEVTP